MAGKTIKVLAEWAWHGKRPEDRGYSLLASSAGKVSARNFDEILTRFSPGTLDTLPQVTVSYVPAPEGGGYLGMAIHELQANAYDALGRDVMFTRYFCFPYQEVVAGAVSYVSLYNAVSDKYPSEAEAEPCEVELPCGVGDVPDIAEQALPVAALLLTGNPICIVDANSTILETRLSFIDSVMTLLPYGFRAEMAAATWTSSTYRTHRFRLFFSDAPRKAAGPHNADHLVRWRAVGKMPGESARAAWGTRYAHDYEKWLREKLDRQNVSKLARYSVPLSFKNATDIESVVERVQGRKMPPTTKPPSPRQEVSASAQPNAPAAAAPRDDAEQYLHQIVEYVNRGDAEGVNNTITLVLKVCESAVAAATTDQRSRYRKIVVDNNLLLSDLPDGIRARGLYKAILRLLFGNFPSYRDFCDIERITEGFWRDGLLHAISDEAGADSRLKIIVGCLAGDGRQQNLGELVDAAANPELLPPHARMILDLVMESLKTTRRREVATVLPKLRQNGYFAPLLEFRERRDMKYQVDTLTELLTYVYGKEKKDLTHQACREILAEGQPYIPTTALLLAVFRLTPKNWSDIVISYYIQGLACAAHMPQELRPMIGERIPGLPTEQRTMAISAVQTEHFYDEDAGVTRMEHEQGLTVGEEENQENRNLFQKLINPGGGMPPKKPRSRRAQEDG